MSKKSTRNAERRRLALAASTLRWIHPTASARACGWAREDSLTLTVREAANGNVTAKYGKAVQRCGNKFCLLGCAEYKAKKRTERLQRQLDVAHSNGMTVLMLTLTQKHKRTDRLTEQLAANRAAWDAVTTGSSWMRDRKNAGIAGVVWANEDTRGESGWHPHKHALLFMKADVQPGELYELRTRILERWVNGLEKHGFTADEVHGIDLRPVHNDLRERLTVSQYMTKSGGKVAHELTAAHLKSAKGSNMSAQDLIADFALKERALPSAKRFRFSVVEKTDSAGAGGFKQRVWQAHQADDGSFYLETFDAASGEMLRRNLPVPARARLVMEYLIATRGQKDWGMSPRYSRPSSDLESLWNQICDEAEVENPDEHLATLYKKAFPEGFTSADVAHDEPAESEEPAATNTRTVFRVSAECYNETLRIKPRLWAKVLDKAEALSADAFLSWTAKRNLDVRRAGGSSEPWNQKQLESMRDELFERTRSFARRSELQRDIDANEQRELRLDDARTHRSFIYQARAAHAGSDPRRAIARSESEPESLNDLAMTMGEQAMLDDFEDACASYSADIDQELSSVSDFRLVH